jgi:hypothetical protein
MFGPKAVMYPCIAYTEQGHPPTQKYYSVKFNRNTYFRFWRWPPEDWYFPGGILDAEGRHFRVAGLVGWRPRPGWLVHMLDDTFGGLVFRVICGSKFGLDLSAPTRLSLESYKREVSLILYGSEPRTKVQKRDEKRTGAKLAEARSYQEVVHFADWFQKTDGGIE